VGINLTNLPYDPTAIFDNPMVEQTQSAVGTFQDCPQKYIFRYLMWLTTDGVSMPLLTGTAVHHGLAEVLQHLATPAVAIELARVAIDKVFAKHLDNPMHVDKTPDLRKGQAQAHAMIEAYVRARGAIMQEQWEIVSVENAYRCKIDAHIGSALCDRMAGRVDGIITLNEGGNNETWLVEHKTRSTLKGLNQAGTLEMDMQCLWYYQLAMRDNVMATGVMYDVLAKPSHRLNDRGWLELMGRMLTAMMSDPAKYLLCEPIPLSEDNVIRASNNFARTMDHMDNLTPQDVLMHTHRCTDYYSDCPYAHLCRAGADAGEPESVLAMPEAQLYIIKEPHEELNDD